MWKDFYLLSRNNPRPALRAGGRGLFDFCVFVVFWYLFHVFPDVKDVFGIRGAQAWESTFRLLRMIVQGYHYILAIWFTYRIEDHDGFRPGAPSLFLSFFFVFMVKILDCFFLNICVPPLENPKNWWKGGDLETINQMLSAPLIDGSPYLFHFKNICHLYSLLAPIKTIMNSILSGWTEHVLIFFAIAVAGIHLTNALSSQKWLYILPSSFFLEWLLIVFT